MNVYSLASVRNAELPTPQPVVEGLLNEGETILLVGRPKVGKSRLVHQLSIDLSRGQPFLSYPIPKPRRVLLLDLENRISTIKTRFNAMSAPEPEADKFIGIYAPETLAEGSENVNAKGGLQNLQNCVAKFEIDVLIIDTWRLFAGNDENDAASVVKALTALSSVRRIKPSLAVVIVHHLRKDKFNGAVRLRNDPHAWVESVSGHHALVSHVDACFGLEREVDVGGITDGQLIVFGGVARNAASSVLFLEEDEETLRFAIKSEEKSVMALLTIVEADTWKHATDLGSFTFTQLIAKANTKNRKAVSSMLRKVMQHQLVTKDGDKYTVRVP